MPKYDCMTPEELALWRSESAWYKTKTPCIDCPMSFHLQEKAAGRCDSVPGGRPPTVDNPTRAYWREKSRSYRARQRAATGGTI